MSKGGSVEVNRKAFNGLTMTQVSAVRGGPRGAPAPRNLAKITVRYLQNMELPEGDLKLI